MKDIFYGAIFTPSNSSVLLGPTLPRLGMGRMGVIRNSCSRSIGRSAVGHSLWQSVEASEGRNGCLNQQWSCEAHFPVGVQTLGGRFTPKLFL